MKIRVWPLLAAFTILMMPAGCCPFRSVSPAIPATPLPVAYPAATATLPSAAPSPSTSPLPGNSPLPTQSVLAGPCEFFATSATRAYVAPGHRPIEVSLEEAIGYPVEARTPDGWLGFDPAFAHAAAVGLLRLWWVRADAVRLQGDCESVPVVEDVPRPDLYCYEMAMRDIPLRAEPDANASIVGTLRGGDYAVLLGFSPDNAWGKVLLSDGTQGWFDLQDINITGACEALPTLQP